MPDILMLSRSDWSNTGFRFYKCISHLGLNVKFLKANRHEWYVEQGEIDSRICPSKLTGKQKKSRGYPKESCMATGLRDIAKKAKAIHFIASTFVDTGSPLSGKFVVVQHGGSPYRQNPANCNQFFNKIVSHTIIQTSDLLELGAKNESLIYSPVDTDLVQTAFLPVGDKVVIGHFPSNPAIKGTCNILSAIDDIEKDREFAGRFEYVGYRNGKSCFSSWKMNLQKMLACDIVIETCNPSLDGRVFGEWGNTSLEAAALGKIVITNSLNIHRYEKEYGKHSLFIANDTSQISHHLRSILSMKNKEIEGLKVLSREWVVRSHSIPFTAQRLWNKIYRFL